MRKILTFLGRPNSPRLLPTNRSHNAWFIAPARPDRIPLNFIARYLSPCDTGNLRGFPSPPPLLPAKNNGAANGIRTRDPKNHNLVL